jgi:hypothetical protein
MKAKIMKYQSGNEVKKKKKKKKKGKQTRY